jgi:hypothetical protein
MKTSNQFKLPQKLSGLFIPLILACFALSQSAQGVVPPPDGGYPGFTTAEGTKALFSLTAGSANTAVGWYSLFSNAEGSFNTATGAGTLLFNTADNNTAFGAAALLFNTTGSLNTGVGVSALLNNATGGLNTAVGFEALSSNTVGISNTAVGTQALSENEIGNNNTAIGQNALPANTTGGANTAIGRHALFQNTTGSGNIALGASAGEDLTSGDSNIDVGSVGVAGESNTIRIGSNGVHTATYIAGISGATASGGVQVFVATDGKLGTLTSSARFKDDINPMGQASEAILGLKPVKFRYKKEIDPKSIPQFGLVAEDVEKVNPDLVVRDKEGKPYSVRYEAVNAMLLNEFLKTRAQVDEQQKQIDALTAGLQKVSAQLEASKPAPQVVKNTE